MKQRKLTPEGVLTQQIRGILNAAGIFHYKNHGGLGSARGLPDITGVLKDGRGFWIEIKTDRGKLSYVQRQFIDRITESGGLAFVARSVEDVIKGLGLQDKFVRWQVAK